MIATTEKTINASFNNKAQQSLEVLSRQTAAAFDASGIATKATDVDIREKLDEERIYSIEKNY